MLPFGVHDPIREAFVILRTRSLRLDGERGPIHLWRSAEGVVHVSADAEIDLARGLGFAHAHDRLAQMMFTRLVGQGRLAECLRPEPDAIAVDIAMSRMGMARDAHRDVANLSANALEMNEAYSDGVNRFLERHRPTELRLAGYQPEPWRTADSLLMVKLMTYVGLAQSQEDIEKWIIQAVQAGVELDRLRALFAPGLDGFDPEWLRGVEVTEPLIAKTLRWLPGLPRVMASNNWVVAGNRTASGHPILCNDPHLEVNRLPAVVSEVVLTGPDGYWMGATIPGINGVLFGRSRQVAFGLTYGFADQIDYFVEDCRDGQFRRDDEWVDFDKRNHLVLRKGDSPIPITVYENLHGVLEGDPEVAGRYLCRAWSGHRSGASATLNAMAEMWHTDTAEAAMDALSKVSLSGNWVVADRDGNIGYQMSGAVPARPAHWSGLYPVPGWDPHYDWQGLVEPEQLSRLYNPPEGYIASANDDWNQPGRAQAITLHMASYRADRIRELLAENPRADVASMQAMHRDLVSRQARRFLAAFGPLLPATPIGDALRSWDGTYAADSDQAAWFEKLYRALKLEVFGKGWLGEEAWLATEAETGVLTDFHGYFDDILLEADPRGPWFGSRGRDALVREVAAVALSGEVTPWRKQQTLTMSHIFLAKLPDALGFDHGPIVLPGSRATIPQASIYRSHGRVTSFHPCFRMVTDLGEDIAYTNMAGGPSGDRMSPWYKSDIPRWLGGRYKRLDLEAPPPGPTLPAERPGPSGVVALARELIGLARHHTARGGSGSVD